MICKDMLSVCEDIGIPTSADDVPMSTCCYGNADGTPTSADVEPFQMPSCRGQAHVWSTSACRYRDADFIPMSTDVGPTLACLLGPAWGVCNLYRPQHHQECSLSWLFWTVRLLFNRKAQLQAIDIYYWNANLRLPNLTWTRHCHMFPLHRHLNTPLLSCS